MFVVELVTFVQSPAGCFPLLPVFMLNQAKRLLASSIIRRREWNQSTHSSLSTLEKNVYFPKMPL